MAIKRFKIICSDHISILVGLKNTIGLVYVYIYILLLLSSSIYLLIVNNFGLYLTTDMSTIWRCVIYQFVDELQVYMSTYVQSKLLLAIYLVFIIGKTDKKCTKLNLVLFQVIIVFYLKHFIALF